MQTKNINIHIGNKLRIRRITLGLSQSAIAEKSGITPQQVQKYEKGVNSMNAERLIGFAEMLKVPVNYFFEGMEQKPAAKGKKFSFAEDADDFDAYPMGASDRESIELLKAFKRIKDSALRKRVADLVRSISIKGI